MKGSRPRVVVVATDPPWPSTSGGDLRIAALVRALADSADVTPVLFPLRKQPAQHALPPSTIVHPSGLPGPSRRAGLRMAGLITGRHPFLEHLIRTGAPEMLSADLGRLKPDVLVLTYPLTGPFLAVARGAGSRLVFDLDTSHRLVDRRQLRASRGGSAALKSALDLLVAGRMERGLERLPDEIWVSSRVSAQDLAKRTSRPIRLVPNTVDVDRYARYRGEVKPGVLTFVGSFDYAPNRIAALRLARRILPILRHSHPDAHLRLVGRHPPASIRALARDPRIDLFADAADAWDLLAGLGPLVVPLTSGGGTRLKVLEAIAAGIPVVGTSMAFEGLDLVADDHVLVADGDADLAAAVLSVWDDPGRATAMASAALDVVISHYDVGVLTPLLGDAIRRLADGPTGEPPRSAAGQPAPT